MNNTDFSNIKDYIISDINAEFDKNVTDEQIQLKNFLYNVIKTSYIYNLQIIKNVYNKKIKVNITDPDIIKVLDEDFNNYFKENNFIELINMLSFLCNGKDEYINLVEKYLIEENLLNKNLLKTDEDDNDSQKDLCSISSINPFITQAFQRIQSGSSVYNNPINNPVINTSGPQMRPAATQDEFILTSGNTDNINKSLSEINNSPKIIMPTALKNSMKEFAQAFVDNIDDDFSLGQIINSYERFLKNFIRLYF